MGKKQTIKLRFREFIILFALATVIILNAQPLNAKEFKLVAAANLPPLVPWISQIRDFVVPESNKQLEAMGSPHRIKWTQAYSGALFGYHNTLEAVSVGLADIAWVGTMWEPAKMPLYNITYYAPFATTSGHIVADTINDLHDRIPAMKKSWTDQNQVFLGAQSADTYHIITKFPLRKFSDLKGKRILVGGAVANWLKGTGAVAVDTDAGSIYNRLNTGYGDGAIIVVSAMLPFKLHEVAPYVTEIGFGAALSGSLAMNLDTWNSMPPEMQSLFKKLGREYSKRVADIGERQAIEFKKIMIKQGAKFSVFPPVERQKWIDALPDLAGDWVKRGEAEGLPSAQVLSEFMNAIRLRDGVPGRNWDK